MPYRCIQCGEKHDKLPTPLACRKCAGRMFLKDRPRGPKMVKAI